MKLTRQLTALILALLMAAVAPITVFADAADGFELVTNTTSLFAGMTYEVTATVSNASRSEAENNNGFTWSITGTENGASISSKKNYKATSNGDSPETFTVTETATFVMPSAGTQATVTAKLGSSRQETLTLSSLQPIESFGVTFSNYEHAYFNANNNTVYVDRKASSNSTAEYVNFSINNIRPIVNNDRTDVSLGGFSVATAKLSDEGDNLYSLSFENSASGAGTINCITESGKTLKSYNVQVCIPAQKYSLSVTPHGSTTSSKFVEVDSPDSLEAVLTAVEGKAFSITASGTLGNDDIKYELFTDPALTNRALDKYYTTIGKKCEISIDVPGTYYLKCKNYSKDNGMLQRGLGVITTKIIVSKAYPIQNIELFKLDAEGNKTDEKLEELTLYTNTSTDTSTYNLGHSVVVTPASNTDSYSYMSSDPAVAKVDSATGLITAVSKGTTTIWVRSADNAEAIASIDVNVRIGVISITSIKKADGTTSIPSGHVQKLVLTTNPEVVDEPIYWSTSNPDILSIDPKTGVATAKTVNSVTPVYVYATTESGVSSNTPINVVPANRATALSLSVETQSTTVQEDTEGAYTKYIDYYQTKDTLRKPFTITADAPGAGGTQTNDEYLWTVNYNGGVGLSVEEAASNGIISYVKNSAYSYSITPLKLGEYAISCTATTDITSPTANDPSDTVIISLVNSATIITVKDSTGANLATTSYIPIKGKTEITVKTSTADNDKHIDPPTCTVLSGGEYVRITERVSDDGEGITYTIEGISYGFEATKIRFASKSSSKESTYNVYVRNNLNDAEVTGVPESAEYDMGKAITFPDIELKYNGTSIDSSMYTVTYSNNKQIGIATITFAGKSDYQGSKKIVTFKITPMALDDTTVFSSISAKTLTTTARSASPTPTVTFKGTRLTNKKDYILTYIGNDRAGMCTVIATGINNFTGSASTTFKIIDTAAMFKVDAMPVKVYSGKAINALPVVRYNGKVLKKDVDYTLKYSNNVNAGKATVTITGIGYYNSYITKTFSIKPKQQKITSLTKKESGSFTVGWQSQPGASGYQIQYALKKNFKKGKASVNIGSYYTSNTVRGLKKNKTYYVRVRSYVVIDNVKVYGKWSKVKKIKTK